MHCEKSICFWRHCLDTVLEVIAEFVDVDPADITLDTTIESLKIDSLDMVEIVMSLEEKYDIQIEEQGEIKKIGDLVELIESNK